MPPPLLSTLDFTTTWEDSLASISRAIAHREAVRRELARRELVHFTNYFTRDYQIGWIHREICELLMAFIEACERKLGPRLIIQLPPRHGKSQIVSRCFPAFLLGKHPEWEVVTATYAQDLASDLGRDVRSVLNHATYTDLFPSSIIQPDSNAIDFVKMAQGGSYRAVGVGGGLTGMGAHAMLIDDPVKNREDADSELVRETTWKWYQTVARTRLAPGGGICICLTRWHEDDLAGKLLQQQEANPEASKWHVYSFPAIATTDEKMRLTGEALHPERWPLPELQKLKGDMDPREWSALYQQNPTPPEGLAFKREWFAYEVPPKDLNWYVSTDFAIGEKTTNDFTVLWPFGVSADGTIYFDHPIHDRMNSMDIVEKICDILKDKSPRQMAIENVHISKSIGPYLQKRMRERECYSTVLWDYTANRDKLARSSSLRARMQQGKVRFHPMTKNLIEEEFIPFPAGRHDDAVDAASVGILMLNELITPQGPPPPPKDGPPAWSYEWMQDRIAKSSGESRSHVPKHLNGRPREKREKPTWKS